jgi:predicted tellurium resistance membrane protein TerC
MPNTKAKQQPLNAGKASTVLVYVLGFAWLIQFVLTIMVLLYLAFSIAGVNTIVGELFEYLKAEKESRQKYEGEFDKFYKVYREKVSK